jgi:succinate-acetate transporter protein
MAIFCGGLAMILAGMWAFPRGDAFIGTSELSSFFFPFRDRKAQLFFYVSVEFTN